MESTDKTQVEQLLPCPLCGGEAIYIGAKVFHNVKCLDCGTLSGTNGAKAETIAAWNRRVPDLKPGECRRIGLSTTGARGRCRTLCDSSF